MADSPFLPAPDRPLCRPSQRRQWFVATGLAVCLGLVGVGAWGHVVHASPRHLRTVTPGVLYRSAWPTAGQLARLVARYRIRTVVNLCLPTEEASLQDGKWDREEQQCRDLGVSLVHFPLPGNTPPNEGQVHEWLRLCRSPEVLPVLVHCAQGVIRTNGLVAVYRIGILGTDNETVFRNLPEFGHDLLSPKRAKLNEFILSWRPDRPVKAGSQNAVGGLAAAPPMTSPGER